MGTTASYQRLENYDHLYKISETHYFDPVENNMLEYKNGKYEKWNIDKITLENNRRYSIYMASDEKGVMIIYDPKKMHEYYFKKYIESVKQKAVDEFKSLDK